jgi:heptosyltransferase II
VGFFRSARTEEPERKKRRRRVVTQSPRILVVAPNWIGDAVLAQPLFARLKVLYPGASIDALAPAWVASVINRMPEISRVIVTPFDHGPLQWKSRRSMARELRSRGYGRAYVLPNSFKAALIPWMIGIGERVGYYGEARFVLLNVRHRLKEKAVPLMVDRYAQLAEPKGKGIAETIAMPRLRVDTDNIGRALVELNLNRSLPIVAFCPGAEFGPTKRWPARYFAALATHFQRQGYQVWLFGSAKDKEVCAEIQSLAPNACISLAGRTGLSTAIDLLSIAELVVTNDSGLMHIAAAVGRRVVAIYGSSSPFHTPPLTEHASIARLNLKCSPCFERECPLGHMNCMNTLSVEQVMGHIRQVGLSI